MEKKEFFDKLSSKAKKMNVYMKDESLEKFYQYMNLLLSWNEKMNLTAITEPKDVILKHFIDCMTIGSYVKEDSKILDIGTGAGFPGIPLKILNPNCQITLVDSLNKRIQFLNEVCKELNFEYIKCVHGRAEDLATQNEYRECFTIVTSRAVARLNILLEYMLPFIEVGGLCICMKGSEIEEEVEEAKKAICILGGEIIKIEKIQLPESDIIRNNIIIKKISRTPDKYPRKAGIPTKQPIL